MLPEFLARRLNGSRLLRPFNFLQTAHLNGCRIVVPVQGGLGLVSPPLWRQEPWLNRVIAQALATTPGTFVDVGVNLGQTLLKVKTLRPDAPYVGFEPNPVCVRYARDLVAANGFSECTIAPFGLSERAGVIPLFARPDDIADSAATLVPGMYTTQTAWVQTPVAVLPGDAALLALGIDRIGVIKIDVEGGELEVIRGLEGVLAASRPIVLCEILPTYSGRDARLAFRQPRIDALVALIQALGYRILQLHAGGHVSALDTIAPHSDPALSNYAFVRAEMADTFAARLNEGRREAPVPPSASTSGGAGR